MSQKDIRVGVENLEQFCIEVFVATGFSAQAARTQADVLVWADLRGVDSHGVMRIPRYVEWLRSGAMRGDAVPEIASDLGAAGVVEAAQAPGAVAMSFAMNDAMERARAHAIGWTLVRHTTHSGAVGYYAAMAARDQMIGIAVATSRPNMAYHGARAAGVATTPIAIAVPGGPHGMLLLDMSTSALPIGKIRAARAKGEPLPGIVALTADGTPTNDASEAAFPLPLGGPKGSGLSLLLECLTGVLIHNPLLEPALAGSQKGHAQNGLAAAIDIAAFSGVADFEAQIVALAQSIKGLPPAEPGGEVLLPGEPELRESVRRRDGIPIPRKTWLRLMETAQGLGVSPPPIAE